MSSLSTSYKSRDLLSASGRQFTPWSRPMTSTHMTCKTDTLIHPQWRQTSYAALSLKQVKKNTALNATPSHTATGWHLPYGITQCYQPPYTSEHTPPLLYPQAGNWFIYPRGM